MLGKFDDVAICKYKINEPDNKYRIGQMSSSNFGSNPSKNELFIEYENGDPMPGTSLVELACDAEESYGRLEFLSDLDYSVLLRFYTRHACAPVTSTRAPVAPPFEDSNSPQFSPTWGFVISAVLIILCAIITVGIIVLCVKLCKPKGGRGESASTGTQGSRTAANSSRRSPYGNGWVPPDITGASMSSRSTTTTPGSATAAARRRPQEPANAGQRWPIVVDAPHPAYRPQPPLSLNVPTPGHPVQQVPIGFGFALPSYDEVLLMKELESRPAGAYVVAPLPLSQPTQPGNRPEENN